MTKQIVVTGGSSGIGKAAAQHFIEQGHNVIIFDTAEPDFDVVYHQVDVRHEEQIAAAFSAIKSLDVAVNSAGVYRIATAAAMPVEDLNTVIDTNLKGTFLMSKHALPLLEKTSGVLINIASSLGVVPEADSPAYCASKAGVIMLTKCLALAHAGKVRVNAVLPGPIDTPMLQAAFTSKEEMAEYAKTVPMQRIGTPQDVANVIDFLVSDKAAYVTGATYTVDGGEVISR